MFPKIAGVLFLSVFVVQGFGLEEPSQSKIEEYKNLISEWAATAQRIARSLNNKPQEDSAAVSQELEDALDQGRRQKRDTTSEKPASEKLQDMFKGFNDQFKSFMTNVTSSSLYQEVSKFGESMGEKGKEMVGQLQDQIKNLQNKPEEKKE